MNVYGKRAKPGAWPHALYRSGVSYPKSDQKFVEMLVHGIWGSALSLAEGKASAFFELEQLNRLRAKKELHEYDADVWSPTIDQRVSKLVEDRTMSVIFRCDQLGAIADGEWGDVYFTIISRNVFRVHDELFQWVQRSGARLKYHSYPKALSVIWVNVETSLYTTVRAAQRQFDDYRSEFCRPDYHEIQLHTIPEKASAGNTWVQLLTHAARQAIIEKQDAELREKAAKARAREEEERGRKRETREAKKRQAEEKRRLAREEKEKKQLEEKQAKQERERIKAILDKPVQDLTREEYAQRMKLRRENNL